MKVALAGDVRFGSPAEGVKTARQEVRHLFRAEINQCSTGPIITLEGRLVGHWAEQAKSLISNRSLPKGLVVDLTGLSYVDSVGEQVLNWFKSIGAVFIGKNIYAAGVCELLKLPLREELAGHDVAS